MPETRERRAQRLGHAEVGDQRMLALGENVARLDVPVHHAALVGVVERVHHVVQHAHDLAHVELRFPFEAGAERFALDEGHGVVEQLVVLAGRQQRDDMRVLELGGELDLTAEAVAVDAGGEVGREHLHDHFPAQRHVGGHEDAAHPGPLKLGAEFIRWGQRFLEVLDEAGHDSRIYLLRPGPDGGCSEITFRNALTSPDRTGAHGAWRARRGIGAGAARLRRGMGRGARRL